MGKIWIPGGGGGADLDLVTASASDIRNGKVIVDQDGNPLTGTMAEKAAATYTPGTANQIISANQYLAGAQTIKGDSNLVASKIKKGVTIFGITGTWEGYVTSPLYLYNKGTWSNLQTTGMKNAEVYSDHLEMYNNYARTNQVIDLTNYKYLKISAAVSKVSVDVSASGNFASGHYSFGVNKDSTSFATSTAEIDVTSSRSGYTTEILDISSLTGSYYLWITSAYYSSGGSNYGAYTWVNQIFLSNT